MSATIWKFPLTSAGGNSFYVDMPAGAKVLSAGWQPDHIVVWAIVDPDAERMRFWFHIAGTGHELPDAARRARFVGRVEFTQLGVLLQFHVFDTGYHQVKVGDDLNEKVEMSATSEASLWSVSAMVAWVKKARDAQYRTDIRLVDHGLEIIVEHKGLVQSAIVAWRELIGAARDPVVDCVDRVNSQLREHVRGKGDRRG